jgi:N-acyl-D-aspartate/D-glutamate deacylase
MWADVTIFDPARIADRATYEQPQQYAVACFNSLEPPAGIEPATC